MMQAMIVLLAIIILCLAFVTEATFGFGGGLIAVPLLSLFLGVQDAVTTVLIFQFGMGVLLLKSYKNIDWAHACPLTIGLLAGTMIGTYGLATIDERILTKILAVSILLFLVLPYLLKKSASPKGRPGMIGVISGIVGGWFQGITGTGGPVFTMYLSIITQDKYAFRATLIFVFFITSIIRVITSFSFGLFTQSVLTIALFALAPYLAVLCIGSKLHVRVKPEHFRTGVNIILWFAAFSLIFIK